MISLIRTLAACRLLAGVAAAAHGRYAAVETGAILLPRQYNASPAQPLGKRQDGCNAGWHPCNEIGPPGATICCPNNQYCIIDPSNPTQGACCYIGADCGTLCKPTAFECLVTREVTITLAPGPSSTLLTTSTIGTECCPRRCTQLSMYGCASSLGGGCCNYDARCASGGKCYHTASAEPTSVDLGIAPPGCSTGQISCASSLGGGCCAATQSCTLIDGGAHCAETPFAAPTGTGSVEVVEVGEGGMSTGAKAGIAVGVVVGAGVVVGLVTWWCLRRRRAARSEMGASTGAGPVGRVVGGGPPGREMSDENSDVVTGSGRLAMGQAQDYFGPAPAMGPYSEEESQSAVTTPGDRGGVPLQPHGPGDIAVPVELDSRLREERRVPEPLVPARREREDDGQERYELYGSDVGQISPSLVSPYTAMPSPPEETRRF